jgi:hypothetical protein
MAGRKATEKTPVAKAFEAAKKAYKEAKERNTKNDTDATKATLKTAKDKLDAATKEMNRERFISVGNARLTKAVAALNNFAKVANPRSYSFTETDIKAAKEVIDGAVKTVHTALDAALRSGAGEKKAAGTVAFFK